MPLTHPGHGINQLKYKRKISDPSPVGRFRAPLVNVTKT
jgi:hypothetical protein